MTWGRSGSNAVDFSAWVVGIGVLLAGVREVAASGVEPGDEKWLRGLLGSVGVEGVPLRRVERTLKKQTRVMYDIAKDDVERAKQMYCDAGDAVIDRFDPKASEAENLQRMEQELRARLPEAREAGCLNHIENDDVYSVDVRAEAIAEERQEALIAAGKKAVQEGKISRFLYPPLHPGGFHFEFERKR